jgi:hypothetical protein
MAPILIRLALAAVPLEIAEPGAVAAFGLLGAVPLLLHAVSTVPATAMKAARRSTLLVPIVTA